MMATAAAVSRSPSPRTPQHPFSKTSCLEIIPNRIDVEEESRLYDELIYDESPTTPRPRARSASPSFRGPASVFSNDIWLGDNSGESAAFAREVHIGGWTTVGDPHSGGGGSGAYVVYDCALRTKDGVVIHAHKRYSDFVRLEGELVSTLPASLRPFLPPLPPKAPLARYRSAFLARRRAALEHWLAAVLLHPDIGGCEPVRRWVMS